MLVCSDNSQAWRSCAHFSSAGCHGDGAGAQQADGDVDGVVAPV